MARARPYGEIVGRSRLTGGEGYDVTQCYELSFDLIDGKRGVGVRASTGGAWQPPAPDKRTLYFQVSGAPYGKDEVTHYAASGGPALTIARLNPKGRWIPAHIDNDLNATGLAMAYTVLAILDVDADNVPELLIHIYAADSWWDILLTLDSNGINWHQAAQSIGGSTA